MGFVTNTGKESVRVRGVEFDAGETKQLPDYLCGQVLSSRPDIMKPAEKLPEKKPRAKTETPGGVKNG